MSLKSTWFFWSKTGTNPEASHPRIYAYSLAAACTQAPICLREQGQVALSLMQMAMGMVDQKSQAYSLLHSSQGALYASKVQSHIMLALDAAKSSMTCLNTSKACYHLMQIFIPFCWPRIRLVTCKKTNCLQN